MVTLPLFLSDVAGSEILLILVFVLIFFGSKSIPGIARTMGRTIRQIKDASQEVQNEIKKSGGDIRSDFNLQKMMDETVKEIETPIREHAQTLDQATQSLNDGMRFDPPTSFVEPSTPVVTAPRPLDQPQEEETPSEETK